MSVSGNPLGLARRALAHYRAKTTDQADSVMEMPIDAYINPERYQAEIARIYKRLPLALAMSLELPGPGDYRALSVLGVPVLMVRGADGVVRAFLNACRHRGAPICAEGSGRKARFTCPYHAWSYNDRGALTHVYGEETFGSIPREKHTLDALPCAERSGFIWVALSPECNFDIDAWLGGFASELNSLDLENWHLHEQRDLDGPGWKVTWDGYLEAYHHNTLHANSVGKYTVGNLMLHDKFGPHQLITFARRSIAELEHLPESRWQPAEHVRLIHSVFPNLSISGVVGDHCLVSQLFPGPDPTCTITRQTVLASQAPKTESERAGTEAFSNVVLQAVRDEDYRMGYDIQAGMAARQGESFWFGRNEVAVQHYHRWVARFSDEAADHRAGLEA